MKKRILRIIVLVILIGLIANRAGLIFPWQNSTAFAVGDLTVNWGVPEGNPIFTVTDFAPGEMETRTVIVTNNALTGRPVGIRGILDFETPGIANKLEIIISDGITDFYGGTAGTKTLADFFSDSTLPNFVPLSTLAPSGSINYEIKVVFDDGVDNTYQAANIQFDLKIGIAVDVPEACQNIVFAGEPIFGTSGNDRLRGTQGNDLIFGLEGNDRIFGYGGNDCLVGGAGNDELRGETGNDVLVGNEGNDLLIGAVGNDRIFGNEDNDTIRGENNDDFIDGGSGNDQITGGNGIDEIFGGDGDDNIRGENGNDTLVGGSGIDSVNGQAGVDTCDAETEINCEL